MSNFNKDQFNEIIGNEDFDNDEYLMSFVECDNCGQDTHMDDAIVVHPSAEFKKQHEDSPFKPVTNYYCGPVCRDIHQSGSRKGMIGNPLGQIGVDPSEVKNLFKDKDDK
jgi:hypothetical protein